MRKGIFNSIIIAFFFLFSASVYSQTTLDAQTISIDDITTASRVIFPRDAPLYFPNEGDAVELCDFAHASMAVPHFFFPKRVEYSTDLNDWYTLRGIKEKDFPNNTPPKEAFLVDGGLLSNFPFDVLHAPKGRKPKMPTFGVKLQVDYRITELNSFPAFFGGCINAS